MSNGAHSKPGADPVVRVQFRDWHRQHVGEPQAPFHYGAGLSTRLSRLDQSSQTRDKCHNKSRTSCSSTDGLMVSVANFGSLTLGAYYKLNWQNTAVV